MIKDLLDRPTPKRPETLEFKGRVLFLVDDSDQMKAQLEDGVDLPDSDQLRSRLRDQISTDEITPAYICYFHDETLGEFPYLGLMTTDPGTGEKAFPVTRGSVKAGGFVCSVAGKRRGKGSQAGSRAPYAELMAGIQIVVGESIERIYNENCQNLGILTTTDFGVIERIRAGEVLSLDESSSRARTMITRQIIQYGGLFEFNVARLQGKVELPEAAGDPGRGRARRWHPVAAHDDWPRRSSLGTWSSTPLKGDVGVDWVSTGEAGFFRTDIRFSHEYVTPMGAIFFEEKVGAERQGRRSRTRSSSSGIT